MWSILAFWWWEKMKKPKMKFEKVWARLDDGTILLKRFHIPQNTDDQTKCKFCFFKISSSCPFLFFHCWSIFNLFSNYYSGSWFLVTCVLISFAVSLQLHLPLARHLHFVFPLFSLNVKIRLEKIQSSMLVNNLLVKSFFARVKKFFEMKSNQSIVHFNLKLPNLSLTKVRCHKQKYQIIFSYKVSGSGKFM